jgi:MFS family permease
MIQTTMYSISTNFYPENKESMVGFIEAVTGVGLIMGPLIGSFLYAIGGYRFIFYSFGLLFVISSFFVKSIFPATVDGIGAESIHSSSDKVTQNSSPNLRDEERTHSVEMMESDYQSDDDEKINIGTFELLKNARFFFAAASGTLGYFLYGFMEPILAFRVKEFDLDQVSIGLFFIIMPVFYIPTSIVV